MKNTLHEKTVLAVCLAAITHYAVANPMTAALKIEDESRICPAAAESVEARLLRREARYVVDMMGLDNNNIVVLVANCGNYAVAATSLNTVIISPALADLPKAERLFLLAHELGHLANGDYARFQALWSELMVSAEARDNVDRSMSALSRFNEKEADIFSARFMHKARLNGTTAAQALFTRLGLLNLPETASHPSAHERINTISHVEK